MNVVHIKINTLIDICTKMKIKPKQIELSSRFVERKYWKQNSTIYDTNIFAFHLIKFDLFISIIEEHNKIYVGVYLMHYLKIIKKYYWENYMQHTGNIKSNKRRLFPFLYFTAFVSYYWSSLFHYVFNCRLTQWKISNIIGMVKFC